MLKKQFDPKKPYFYIRYARMSDPRQNPCSPDQQFNNIDLALSRCGYDHWTHIRDYRDDGISGRVLRKRVGFTTMLSDIKSGIVSPDLILVDDIDRFGRMDELRSMRRDLFNRHGVLILDAKSNYSDPEGPQGRIYSAIEELRASEEGRTKSHRVMRGKRDCILKKRWPGGVPPFGYRLERKFEEVNGHSVAYTVIVPAPETGWIVRLAFEKADETGWGQARVARFLNDSPEIPDDFKPFQAATVGEWFTNGIFIGIMRWPKVSTDIIDDCRVIEPVAPEDQLRVVDYCEPIVAVDLFDRVWKVRTQRGAARKAAIQSSNQTQKNIKAPVPGLTLKFALSGLVKCGHCGRSMVPNGSGAYLTKDGQERRYTAYHCPGSADGNCTNSQRIPEDWLRQTVIDTLRKKLFPRSDG